MFEESTCTIFAMYILLNIDLNSSRIQVSICIHFHFHKQVLLSFLFLILTDTMHECIGLDLKYIDMLNQISFPNQSTYIDYLEY